MSCPWDEPDHNPREWRQALREARAEHSRRREEDELLHTKSSKGPMHDGVSTGPCKGTVPDRGDVEQRAWLPKQRAHDQRCAKHHQSSKEVYREDEQDDVTAEGADPGADDDQSEEQPSEHDSASSDGEPVQCEEAEGSASSQGDYEESVDSAPYESEFVQDYNSDFDQDYNSEFEQDYLSDFDQDYGSNCSSDSQSRHANCARQAMWYRRT